MMVCLGMKSGCRHDQIQRNLIKEMRVSVRAIGPVSAFVYEGTALAPAADRGCGVMGYCSRREERIGKAAKDRESRQLTGDFLGDRTHLPKQVSVFRKDIFVTDTFEAAIWKKDQN